jgi:serine phosphatase RsbU (regulator of sigma subunit)
MALGWGLFFLFLNLIKNQNNNYRVAIEDEIKTSNFFLYEPSGFPNAVYYSENFLSLEDIKDTSKSKKIRVINNSLQNLKSGTVYIRIKKKKDTLNGMVAEVYVDDSPFSMNIYVDTALVGSHGKFHPIYDSTEFIKSKFPIRFILPDTNYHYLIVHFHVYNAEEDIYSETDKIINVSSVNANSIRENDLENWVIIFFFILLMVILMVLSFYHLFFYLFYKKVKSNLYYSIGMVFYAFIFFFVAKEFKTQSISWVIYKEWFLVISTSGFFISLMLTYYSIFKPLKYILIGKILVIVFILQVCFLIFNLNYISLILTFTLGLMFVFESFRMLYFAYIRKPQGYKILISGILVFAITLLVVLVKIYTNSQFSFKGAYSLLLILFILFIIPITMSVYLAYSFGIINILLEHKLIEVRELSDKNLKIEKEKQELLLNQNMMLEKQVEERTREIQEQKKIIEEKNKDILDSIQYATRIQGSIIPPEEEISKITGYGYVIYLPKDILSGDFYAVHQTGEGIFVIGADCTGHGVPGALMSMAGSTLIQKIINEYKIYSPSLILEKLNEELRVFLRQDRMDSVSKDGMDVAIIQLTRDKLIYAGANRPLWYLDKQNNLNEIRPVKTSIGGNHVNSVNAINHALNIHDLSKIFLFSDGCTDQFGGTLVKKVTSKRLKEWILQSANLGPEDMKSFLLNKITEWKGNQEQTDDILFLCIGFS